MSDLEELFLLQLKAFKLPEPVREYKFHETRKWRFDFAWVDWRIAVEIEGGTWIRGGHSRGKKYESDCEKYNTAILSGWVVLRFTTDMVSDLRAINTLKEAMS